MARPRKPLHILKKQGTYRKDRHGDRETPKPPPVSDLPTPPAWLTEGQQAIFARKAQELMDVGVLTALDVDSLAVYAALLDRVTNGIGQVNGALMSQLRNLANDLGMTPAARQRLGVKKPAPPEANPFDSI